jgi:small subunit ribosomal protein S16
MKQVIITVLFAFFIAGCSSTPDTSGQDGAPVETIGSYDPRAKANGFKVNMERVDYWMSKGALPTDTLHAMIKRARRAAPVTEAAAPAAV